MKIFVVGLLALLLIAVFIRLLRKQNLLSYFSGGRWWLTWLSIAVITLMGAVGTTFFMGFFFMIASYFTPRSYDRKGAKVFLFDRLKRLGIPLLFYAFIVDALIGPSAWLEPATADEVRRNVEATITEDLMDRNIMLTAAADGLPGIPVERFRAVTEALRPFVCT